MSEPQQPYLFPSVVSVFPPGEDARARREADEIATAALNAVDPTGRAWACSPVEVCSAAIERLDLVRHMLERRMAAATEPPPEAA